MIKTVVIASIALLAGLILANSPLWPKKLDISSSDYGLSARVDKLEKRLEDEIDKRKSLEHILEQKVANLDNLDDQLQALGGGRSNGQNNNDDQDRRVYWTESLARTDALVEAGLSEYDVQRVGDLQESMIQMILEARRNNESINTREIALEFQNAMRTELGDDVYERYLEADGRPTSVEVMEVQEDEAGAIAGLQSGDKILNYDGERVFSILDLQRLTREGIEGQTVVMEIEREGSPMTLVIPRGQIGISSDFGRRNGNGRRGGDDD